MSFSLKGCSQAYEYAKLLTLIAAQSSKHRESAKRQCSSIERSSNAISILCSMLCDDIKIMIIRFLIDGRMVVPEMWSLHRMDNVPNGAGILILQHFIQSSPCVGLLATKTQDYSAKLVVDKNKGTWYLVEVITCLLTNGFAVEDLRTISIALQLQVWMQFGPDRFFESFPTRRQQQIVFYVCGFNYFIELKETLTDPRYVELFPYAVAAYLSYKRDERISPLPTGVIQEIKRQFTPSQFKYFLTKYMKSREQETDQLFRLA